MLRQSFFYGLCAGLMISIGAAVFLACDSKYVGAVLFSVALIVICALGMYLYTGKIGMLAEEPSKKNAACAAIGLGANYISATLFGLLCGSVRRGLSDKAVQMCTDKLSQEWYVTLSLGFFCGVLMYAAVKGYALTKSPLVIIFCVSVFILSGFEHSVADMAYFAFAGLFSPKYAGFIALVVLGNTIGALTVPILMRLGKRNGEKGERA